MFQGRAPRMNRLASLATAFALLSAAAMAQNIAGSITGEVVDPTGLPLARANVSLLNVGNKAQLSALTSDQGVFEFLTLQPGVYDVTIEVPGFKRLTRSKMQLSAN